MTALLLAEPLAKAGEGGKSGPVGLAIIVILCIVCYFLFKSMSKHMRRVREDFPAGPDEPRLPEPERPTDLAKPAADSPAATPETARSGESPGAAEPAGTAETRSADGS